MQKIHTMKKFLSICFLIFSVVIIVISCKKETNSATPTPIDTSKITFGNTEGMNVVTLDSIYLTNHPNAGYYYTENIDFDGDGLGDNIIGFEIIAGAWVGCGSHNVGILGESYEKKTFIHNDTSYYSHDGIVEATFSEIYSNCGQIADNDSVMMTSQALKVTANDEGAQMSVNDNFGYATTFHNDAEIFCGDLFSDSYYYSNDTVYQYTFRYINHCSDFATGKPEYIGFKVTEDDRTRLGWVKVELIPSDLPDDYFFKIIEAAIQK